MKKFLTLLILMPLLSFANEMTFEMGRDVDGFNVPYVTLTVCEPGTDHCQSIDRIKLDTGSEGLRIFKSALQGLNLPIEHDPAGNDLALCANFGSGLGNWGPITKADVMLGDEPAKGLRLQIIDPTYPSHQVPCLPPPPDGRKGIMGLNMALEMAQGKTYYACSSQNCTATHLRRDQEPLNPLSYFAHDGNGFMVRTPAIPPDGLPNLQGSIIFGIGTRNDNRPPTPLSTCHVRQDGFLPLRHEGKTYWTALDSGTNSYNLPTTLTTAHCGPSSVFLCPAQSENFDVEILNADGSTCASPQITVIPASHGPGSTVNSWVLPGLGEVWGGALHHTFILGIPFFFGRDIYYVLDGRSSPLGKGPLVAF